MHFFAHVTEDSQLAASIPPPAVLGMVEASMGWVQELKGAGKVDWFWVQADSHAAFMMFDVDSHAELMDLIESMPARPFMKIETHAVISTDDWGPIFAKTKERMLKTMAAMQQG